MRRFGPVLGMIICAIALGLLLGVRVFSAPAPPVHDPQPAPNLAAVPTPQVVPSPTAPPALAAAPTTHPPTATPPPSPRPRPTASPSPQPTPHPSSTPLVVHGRHYDAYIAAASKAKQEYQYSCEFDAAWVIFKTFGLDVGVKEMVDVQGIDTRIEPYYEETADGFMIHGGDIATRYSGDYTKNFLARSTGAAMRRVFEHYGLSAAPVHDRAGVEAALRAGALVWMKTTVDFKPWRPATWRTPEGATFQTVLGNDHAVVVIGFNATHVVIRDVLGPTSSNRQRPYEYEVAWDRFLEVWQAQSFDGLAVAPPT